MSKTAAWCSYSTAVTLSSDIVTGQLHHAVIDLRKRLWRFDVKLRKPFFVRRPKSGTEGAGNGMNQRFPINLVRDASTLFDFIDRNGLGRK